MESAISIEIRKHCEQAPWTYFDLDQRQRVVAARARSGGVGGLLLNEVAPVITLGRRTPSEDLLFHPDHFREKGISVHQTDRGGLATYHGPGQWVLFAVDRLENLTGDSRGVRKAVESLLAIGHQVASEFEPRAEIRGGAEMGVWSPRGKLASVGVHIEQGVLLHGLALNAYRTPTSFLGLRPCGLDAPVDFLTPDSPSDFDRVGGMMIEAALERFWQESRLQAVDEGAFSGL